MGTTKFTQGRVPSHARIYRRQMDSIAWRHLSPSAVKVLLHLALLERGKNNGELFFSDRQGSEWTGLSRNTVWRALRELQEKGFIYCAVPGGFSRKTAHAACYGLTWEAGPKGGPHRAPTHAYEKWEPDGNTRSQSLTETGSISNQPLETGGCTGSDIVTGELENPPFSVGSLSSGIEPQAISQGIGAKREETEARKQADLISAAFPADARERLKDHLAKAGPGEQSRLAARLGIPGGTLSKFVNGRNMPHDYVVRLSAIFS